MKKIIILLAISFYINNAKSQCTITVNSASICIGQETTTLTASGASSYSWMPSVGLSITNGATVTATPTTTTIYTVTGTTGTCTATNTSTVTVYPLPIVTATGDTVCVGQNIYLSASSGVGYSYVWSGPNAYVSYIRNGTVIPNAQPGNGGNYVVTVTDSYGCINSATATVVVTNCTGIEQVSNNNNRVKIYPNPNNGSFVIEPQNTLYNVHCTVYDVNGQMVLTQTINGKTSIDAGSLNEGVYNISLQSNEGVVNKRLVIVR